MIQRIQTLFLLLVAALAVALFFFPAFVCKSNLPVGQALPSSLSMKEGPNTIQPYLLTSIAAVLSGVLALVSVFLYRNRQRQMLLCRLNLLFILATLGLIFQASDTSSLPKPGIVTIQYSIAIYFPLAQIAFNWLALRFIKKDDDLVHSAERLR